jgi:hypothetical protein
MSEWQPIETAPKDGRAILLLPLHGFTATVGRWDDRYTRQWHALVAGEDANWSDLGGRDPIFDASHWMPLPEPPK